jgi:hypothetical protein
MPAISPAASNQNMSTDQPVNRRAPGGFVPDGRGLSLSKISKKSGHRPLHGLAKFSRPIDSLSDRDLMIPVGALAVNRSSRRAVLLLRVWERALTIGL